MERTKSRKESSPNGEASSPEPKARPQKIAHISTTLLAILFVIGLTQFSLDGLQGVLIDMQFRLRIPQGPHPDIALIAYDDSTIGYFSQIDKIPAEELSRLLSILNDGQPQSIGLLLPLSERIYSEFELNLIGETLSNTPNAYVGYIDDASLGKLPPSPFIKPSQYLPGFISRDNFSFGKDSVTRRAMISIAGTPTVYAELARQYHQADTMPKYKRSHPYGDAETTQVYINWQGPPETYSTYSALDVTRGTIPPDTFHNKIVLVGRTLHQKQSSDYILTPYSRDPSKTSILEGAAHGLATLMEDNAIARSNPWLNFLFSLIVGIITVNMVLFLSPVRGIIFTFGVVVLLFIISWFTLSFLNTWIDLAHPFIVACFGYYLVIPYRLVDEYRARWHYQNKSEMVAQLERLKTNFLSLVSHDLKTPVARIQGNAELLLNAVNPNDTQLHKYARSIVATTEGLSQYVQTILDLTRIESTKMPVKRSTKDINTMIRSVVESKRLMADEKNIELTTEMEPLFSFKFDVELIRRVIGNLVENAIKYSPPNTKITLKTHEENNWVYVAVADQGVGISSKDQESIFSKFYRCDNDATKNTKGTGLGLYLVKYFIELHRGTVQLKSELGRGSIFTVGLPT